MILLNTTFAIDPVLSSEVTEWLKNEYIPAATACGFTGTLLSRVLTDAADADAVSLALQMVGADTDAIQSWHQGRGAQLMAVIERRWPRRVLPFVTHLEIL